MKLTPLFAALLATAALAGCATDVAGDNEDGTGQSDDAITAAVDLPFTIIDAKKSAVAAGSLHPKLVKQELARRLVADFHGAAAAAEAEAEFERVFAGGGAPDEVAEFRFVSGSGALAAVGSESSTKVGSLLVEQLVGAAVVASKNEARRLVEQGAVAVDGERVSDPHAALAPREAAYLVKVGKRRFVKLQIQ